MPQFEILAWLCSVYVSLVKHLLVGDRHAENVISRGFGIRSDVFRLSDMFQLVMFREKVVSRFTFRNVSCSGCGCAVFVCRNSNLSCHVQV